MGRSKGMAHILLPYIAATNIKKTSTKVLSITIFFLNL